jgi:hypothetical protein
MLTRSLKQCHGCRLTWFPQAGGAAACPACGGTRVGGTLEVFHAGIVLIALGLIGWFLRHDPLSLQLPSPLAPATAVAQAPAHVERAQSVPPPVVKERQSKPVYVSSKKLKPSKVKASKVKRRPKKANTRSKHVQR